MCGLKGIRIQKRWGFAGGLVVKHLPANARDRGSIPGPRSPCAVTTEPTHLSQWSATQEATTRKSNPAPHS